MTSALLSFFPNRKICCDKEARRRFFCLGLESRESGKISRNNSKGTSREKETGWKNSNARERSDPRDKYFHGPRSQGEGGLENGECTVRRGMVEEERVFEVWVAIDPRKALMRRGVRHRPSDVVLITCQMKQDCLPLFLGRSRDTVACQTICMTTPSQNPKISNLAEWLVIFGFLSILHII